MDPVDPSTGDAEPLILRGEPGVRSCAGLASFVPSASAILPGFALEGFVVRVRSDPPGSTAADSAYTARLPGIAFGGRTGSGG